MIVAMQDVLSKGDAPKVSLRDQEFYELRLYDSESDGEPVYYVRKARAWLDEAFSSRYLPKASTTALDSEKQFRSQPWAT
jgi:uncharacterized protein YqkB